MDGEAINTTTPRAITRIDKIIKKKSFIKKIFSFEELDADIDTYINVNKLFSNLDYQDL